MAFFRLPTNADVPAWVPLPTSSEELQTASRELNMPQEALYGWLLAVLPDFPESHFYQRWFNEVPKATRDGLGVRQREGQRAAP